MDYSIKVRAIDKVTVQDTGENLLSVQFDILKFPKEPDQDPEVVRTGRHGFPLGVTVTELELELKGVLAAFVTDTETAEASAEFTAEDAQADATIAAMLDKEITN
jgi:hypothetical protein